MSQMSQMHVPVNARSASIAVRVIRANGTIEDHGVVAFYHRNPFIRWAYRLKRAIKRMLPWRP